MRKVQRSEILDYATWGDQRAQALPKIFEIKEARRVHVGEYLTFLFENADTVRYQIQEMVRVERIVRDADIRHEIDTYNELLGDDGQLGCTLFIEITSAEERAEKLVAWLGLQEHLYVKLGDGKKVYAQFDARQVGEHRLSSVHYLRFDTGGQPPVAVGCDFPDVNVEAALTAVQAAALAEDLQ